MFARRVAASASIRKRPQAFASVRRGSASGTYGRAVGIAVKCDVLMKLEALSSLRLCANRVFAATPVVSLRRRSVLDVACSHCRAVAICVSGVVASAALPSAQSAAAAAAF